MQHFEDIWNEAEATIDLDIDKCILLLLMKLNGLKDNPNDIGDILLYLSCISKIQNTNVADLLKKSIENFKIDNFE